MLFCLYSHTPTSQQCSGHPGPWSIQTCFISTQNSSGAQSVSPRHANAGVVPTIAWATKRLAVATPSVSGDFTPTLPSSDWRNSRILPRRFVFIWFFPFCRCSTPAGLSSQLKCVGKTISKANYFATGVEPFPRKCLKTNSTSVGV